MGGMLDEKPGCMGSLLAGYVLIPLTDLPITVTLADAAGHQVASLFSGIMDQGSHFFDWKQIGVPDGRYSITISTVSAGAKQTATKTTFYVDRTLARVKLAAGAISPNGDGLFDSTALSFQLNAAAQVRVELWRAGQQIGRAHV